MECKQCKQTITSKTAKLFCSQSCAATFNNANRSFKKKCRTCSTPISYKKTWCNNECRDSEIACPCGDKMPRRAKLCRNCRNALTGPKFQKSEQREEHRGTYNNRMAEYMRTRRRERKQQIMQLLGGKCASCGATENLEVDHADPREKRGEPGRSPMIDGPWERILTELEKCQALCHDCHMNKTRLDYSSGRLGHRGGPKKSSIDWDRVRRLRSMGANWQEVANAIGVSRSTVEMRAKSEM